MRLTPLTELENRCRRLQQGMAGKGWSAVFCLQNADLFYFTGCVQSGCLYVPQEGRPIYMVRREWKRARNESALPEIVPFRSWADIPRILAEYSLPSPTTLGLEMDVLPVSFFERLRALFPHTTFFDATPSIRFVRMIKSAYELQILKEAAVQVDAVYGHACEILRAGCSELELAAELECCARRRGHVGFIRMRVFNGEMFYGHVLSGPDSALPTYTDTPFGGRGPNPSFGQGAGDRKIACQEPIVVDFAGSLDGYLVDQTRIFALGGLPDKLRRGHEDMLVVQQRVREMAPHRPTWAAIYKECVALATQMGYADHFMGAQGSQVSFVGHGTGLEIDEYPFLAPGFDRMQLEPGMVFALEPKLVFPGEGAVGIENTFWIDEEYSAQALTFSPDELLIKN